MGLGLEGEIREAAAGPQGSWAGHTTVGELAIRLWSDGAHTRLELGQGDEARARDHDADVLRRQLMFAPTPYAGPRYETRLVHQGRSEVLAVFGGHPGALEVLLSPLGWEIDRPADHPSRFDFLRSWRTPAYLELSRGRIDARGLDLDAHFDAACASFAPLSGRCFGYDEALATVARRAPGTATRRWATALFLLHGAGEDLVREVAAAALDLGYAPLELRARGYLPEEEARVLSQVAALRDPPETLRDAAVHAVSKVLERKLGEPEALSAALSALPLDAQGQLGGKLLTIALLWHPEPAALARKYIGSGNRWVAVAAIERLGNVGTSDDAPALIRLIEERPLLPVQVAAKRAVAAIFERVGAPPPGGLSLALPLKGAGLALSEDDE